MGDQPQAAEPRADALQAAASELYGLPFDEFIAARNERVKRARAGGDRDLAAAIGKLPKPTMAGWLANQLVRAHPAEVDALLGLGATMRQATAALDAAQLRQLSVQQHQQIRALVRRAADLAAGSGHSLSDSTTRALQDTLHAALADEQAAHELKLGQLSTGLTHSGFPGVSATAASAWTAGPARPPAGGQRTRPRDKHSLDDAALKLAETQRARQAEAQAREDASQATQARQRAVTALAQAELAASQASELVTRLRAELADAIAAQAETERAQRRAAKAAEVAANSVRHSERRLREAIAKLESPDG